MLTEDTQWHTNGEPSDNERLIATLTMQLEVTQESLEQEREANRENRRLLAAALERIPAIEAPPEPRESPQTPSEHQGNGTAHPEDGGTEKPSWLRRFFGFE